MLDRVKHFRAGLLLTISAALLVWPMSYWLPLPEYLGVLASEDYADYSFALTGIVVIYLTLFFLNLVNAALATTKLNHTLKFWLSLVPAVVLLIVPFILVIPTSLRFPERNYFDIFQAMYRLLRFTTYELLTAAMVCTLISVVLNVKAALMFRSASHPESIDSRLAIRYLRYAGVAVLVLAVIVPVGAYNGALRSQDRAACVSYAALEVPEMNQEVLEFLNQIKVIGETAGNKSLQNQFTTFSNASIQFLSLLESEPEGSAVLEQAGELTANAKDELAKACSAYAVG